MSTTSLLSLTCPRCGTQITPPPTLSKVVCPGCAARIRTGSRPASRAGHRAAPAIPAPGAFDSQQPGQPTTPARSAQAVAPAGAPIDPNVQAQLEQIALRNELLRLDRDWDEESKQYYVEDSHGYLVKPTESLVIVRTVVAVAVVAVLLVFTISNISGILNSSMWTCFLSPAPVILGFFLFHMVSDVRTQYEEYEAALSAYLAKREALLRRYRQHGGNHPYGAPRR